MFLETGNGHHPGRRPHELMLEGRPVGATPELILDERVDRFVERMGWERTFRTVDGSTHQVFTFRPEGDSDLRNLNLGHAFLEGRRIAKVTDDGESILLLVCDEDAYEDDLAVIETINRGLAERITRWNFTADELEYVDRIWLPTREIGEATGKDRDMVSSEITGLLRRLHLANRTQLLVRGLKDGFIDAPLQDWQHPRLPLSLLQARVATRGHFKSMQISETLGIPLKSVHSAIREGYRKTGARTRGELMLSALAHGECHLDDIPDAEARLVLTDRECETLSLVDRSLKKASEITGATKTTLSNRFQRLCEKLDLPDREMLVVYAFRHGYIDNTVDRRLAEIFSERQRQVVELSLCSNNLIAELLRLSESVIVHHLVEAKKRAGVDSRAGLVAYGLRAGLIDARNPYRPEPEYAGPG